MATFIHAVRRPEFTATHMFWEGSADPVAVEAARAVIWATARASGNYIPTPPTATVDPDGTLRVEVEVDSPPIASATVLVRPGACVPVGDGTLISIDPGPPQTIEVDKPFDSRLFDVKGTLNPHDFIA